MWYTNKEFQSVPRKFDDSYRVEAVNFDNLPLYYEGVENLTNLEECKSISLRNTKYFDDWSLDRLSGNHLPKLEELDLSGTDVTYDGFGCMYRFDNLKRFIIDKSNRQEIEYLLSFELLEDLEKGTKVLDSSEASQKCDYSSEQT